MPPAGGCVVPPAGGCVVPPAGGCVVPPAGGCVVPPAGGCVVPPAGGCVVPPAGGCVVPPAGGCVVPPAGGCVMPPAGGCVMPPAGGCVMPPAGGCVVLADTVEAGNVLVCPGLMTRLLPPWTSIVIGFGFVAPALKRPVFGSNNRISPFCKSALAVLPSMVTKGGSFLSCYYLGICTMTCNYYCTSIR